MTLLMGCDYHPSVQQIAMLDTETGDYSEHRLKHSDGEAERFYRGIRKQKADRQDAQLLLKLMIEDRFPRVWISSLEHRDLQQLLWHRHRTVQMRTRI